MATIIDDIDRTHVQDIIDEWPDKPTELAEKLIDKYGLPDEVTDERFFWHDAGQWKRMQLYRDGTPHNFPIKHEDHLRQTINYPIDPADAEALIEFDGSDLLWRTRGELSADCHTEPMNTLTLNLAQDIVTGEMTVAEARQVFAETAIEHQMGEEPNYTPALQFDVPQGDQGDPDESNITDALEQEVKERVNGPVPGE